MNIRETLPWLSARDGPSSARPSCSRAPRDGETVRHKEQTQPPRDMLAQARLDSTNRIAPPRVPVNKDLFAGSPTAAACGALGISIETLDARHDPIELITALRRRDRVLAAAPLPIRHLVLGILGRAYFGEKLLDPGAPLAARQGAVLDRLGHRDVLVDQPH